MHVIFKYVWYFDDIIYAIFDIQSIIQVINLLFVAKYKYDFWNQRSFQCDYFQI